MKKHLLIFILIIVTSSCQWLTDRSDKAALAEHFEIPDAAEMIAYDGFPTMVGFGQREGLTISAKYILNDEDMKAWIQKVQYQGLKKLPIEEICRSELWFKDKLVPPDTKSGYYFCRTAGDDVLKAKVKKPCDEVEHPNDLIFAILDTKKKELSVIITSGY